MLSFYKMKRIVFLLIFTLFSATFTYAQTVETAPYLPACGQEAAQNAPITVQFPHENMTVTRGAKNIFLFGKLNLSNATLDINGQSVPVRPDGTFIAFLPVKSGAYTFLLTAYSDDKIYQALRTINVPGTELKDYTQKASFDPEEIYPQTDLELLPLDTVELSARGTPGAEVQVTLSGIKDAKKMPMKEDSPGRYRLKYTLPEDQKPRTAKITYYMKEGPGRSRAKITAPGTLRILDKQEPPAVAQILIPGVKLRKIPTPLENLYPYYRAYGEVQINGISNKQYRIWLNENESAWLEKDKVKPLDMDTYQPNHLHSVESEASPQKTRLFFKGEKEVPIHVQEFNDRLEITLYYTKNFDESFVFDQTSPLVDKIVWSEPGEGTLRFKILFKPGVKLWGHSYNFEDGTLLLDLMHTPQITPTSKQPLKGARILLDAGHSPKKTIPYDGAVGPSGYQEYEATMALAEGLKERLEKAGATVIMTRKGDNHISLSERYNVALKENAHIFVSLHYNAVPETVNPLTRPRGFSVYYTYPHSFGLAKAVYESFTRNVPLPDNGLIANDILFIPRIPQMPSILVENAFLILPEQEALARTPEGQAVFINALYEGILDFYGVKPVVKSRKKPARKLPKTRRKK